MLFQVRNALARLQLILAKLVEAHRNDVLLREDAGLALALADRAIGDGRSILNTFLAR